MDQINVTVDSELTALAGGATFSNNSMNKRYTPHHLSADVLVAGGGPAGVPAAIAAARGWPRR